MHVSACACFLSPQSRCQHVCVGLRPAAASQLSSAVLEVRESTIHRKISHGRALCLCSWFRWYMYKGLGSRARVYVGQRSPSGTDCEPRPNLAVPSCESINPEAEAHEPPNLNPKP